MTDGMGSQGLEGSTRSEESLPASFPRFRAGFISPRSQSDTSSYELYQIAPPDLIVAHARLGVKEFDTEAIDSCLKRNLERCVRSLGKRRPMIIMFAGIPLQLFIDPVWNVRFKSWANEEGATGTTSFEAVISAFRTMELTRVAVINKWSPAMNVRLKQIASEQGVQVVGAAAQPMDPGDFDSSFESGARLALRLTEQAANDYPDAQAIWIAGGAWLTGPLVDQMEHRFGKPVISAQQANPWYCMNRIGCYRPLRGRGSLLERTLVE